MSAHRMRREPQAQGDRPRTASRSVASGSLVPDPLFLQHTLGNRAVAALQRRHGAVAASPALGVAGFDPRYLQRTIGNRATTIVIQRQFEDGGEREAPQPVPDEAGSAVVQIGAMNPFGEIDGSIGSTTVPHAMSNKGQTDTDKWHHAGGAKGGTGNQPTGSADLVAPVYKSKPATATKPAKAWIKSGTGTVKVVRSYVGVTQGNNGAYKHAPGLTWITWKAKWRIAKHERQHIKMTKRLHDQHIVPLEKRISTYRGWPRKSKPGADEATAIAALQTEIDWNTAVSAFAADDTTQNTPMGPVDTIDLAKPDFYFDFGAKKMKKVNYGHYINTN